MEKNENKIEIEKTKKKKKEKIFQNNQKAVSIKLELPHIPAHLQRYLNKSDLNFQHRWTTSQ